MKGSQHSHLSSQASDENTKQVGSSRMVEEIRVVLLAPHKTDPKSKKSFKNRKSGDKWVQRYNRS